ncbi:hypothetical protein MSAN_00122500 [Mycena sanguinolenta]|uniref:Uncharacterized protein n=1 Tax=Mycena sanguinolenta TaxID=230812 RepID=A0A8H6ZGS1_9AGAR|nr:hypothetical protein MSAN_00122500 [Mycena sanguinolenta]
MDDHSQSEPEYTHSSTSDAGASLHASGMFSHSQKFTVTGGTFTNVTNKNYAVAPSLPSDFRMIPMGDIDLRHEIRVDKHTGVAIDRRTKRVTVALYQGNDAEEEWRQDIDKYMHLRHPNIVQICGAASSNGIHATLFNDDLIPVQEVLDRYRDSPCSSAYIYACCVESGFHGGIQLYLFCFSTLTPIEIHKMDTLFDWPALHRAYTSS